MWTRQFCPHKRTFWSNKWRMEVTKRAKFPRYLLVSRWLRINFISAGWIDNTFLDSSYQILRNKERNSLESLCESDLIMHENLTPSSSNNKHSHSANGQDQYKGIRLDTLSTETFRSEAKVRDIVWISNRFVDVTMTNQQSRSIMKKYNSNHAVEEIWASLWDNGQLGAILRDFFRRTLLLRLFLNADLLQTRTNSHGKTIQHVNFRRGTLVASISW